MINMQRLQLVNTILLIGTLSAVLFHYSRFAFIGDHSLHFTSFLHDPLNIFCDFNSIYSLYVTKGFAGGNCYFPGAIIVMQFFYLLAGPDPYFARELLVGMYIGLLALYLNYSFRDLTWVLRLQTVFIWIFCSYSILFTLHTGNIEAICFLLVAFAITLRIKRFYILSAVLIGFAASIKLLPAIFIFTVMNKSNWLKCILSFSLSLLVCLLLPFLATGSFMEYFMMWFHGAQEGMKIYHDMMMVSRIGIIFGHSFLNALRLIIGVDYDISPYVLYYYLAVLPIVLFLIYKITKIPLMYVKVIIAACIVTVFPVTSTDYKLQYFIIPLLLLCHSRRLNKTETWLSVLIALTQIPKGYIYGYGVMYYNINTILNPALLIVALVLSLRAWQSKTIHPQAIHSE